MRIQILSLVILFLSICLQQVRASDWGKTGHRVVGKVAQDHLTPKTKAAVDALLDGMSLAFVSTYADEIRSDSRYDYLDTWHYVNMDKDTRYTSAKKNPDGDIVTAINNCVEALKDPAKPKADKAFYLKLLVHFIGDIHQPMHAGRKPDRGGNEIELTWFGEPTNLHSLWDTDLIQYYEMSYTELAAHLPRLSAEEKENCMTTLRLDWVNESQDLANKVYANTPMNASLGYTYHYQYFETVRVRLLQAGLRLAATLNAIFDSPDAS